MKLFCSYKPPLFYLLLYSKESITLTDLESKSLIVISENDLSIINRKVLAEYKKAGVAPQIRYAPNLQTCMLWIEAGIGAAYLFSRNKLRLNPDLRFVEMDSPWLTSFVISWHKDNYNASIPLVSEFCRNRFH